MEENILLMSKYARKGASSRIRSYQYIPYLEEMGFNIEIHPLLGNQYIEELYSNDQVSYSYVIKNYVSRLYKLLKINKYDGIWMEKELFPWLPAFVEKVLEKLSTPYLVDYDDAIFHRYDQNKNRIVRKLFSGKIRTVISSSNIVTVGNEYLQKYAENAGAKRVEIVPTVVDVDNYQPVYDYSESITVGWIGTPYTAKYLENIEPVLQELNQDYNVNIICVGIKEDRLDLDYEARDWSEDSEIQDIQEFDIGIMPLNDGPFERGKCGYKLIQYMACGKPVVATPVGVNEELVENCGFSVETLDEWYDKLQRLVDDEKLRYDLGRRGRYKIENEYSLQNWALKFGSILSDLTRMK